MNADFILGQLRLALTAFIAYAGGRGWFTPADSTLALAMLTSLGPIAAPWLLSLYSNYGTKHVPKDSVAIMPADGFPPIPASAKFPDTTSHVTIEGSTANGTFKTAGPIVGALLLAAILLAPSLSFAGPIADKIAADVAAVKVIIVADLEAARDDAKSNDDPASGCWIILLDHANRMPPKLMGVAHAAQRLRTLRRSLPAILDVCAVVKDGARQALLQIFGGAVGGVTGLAALGL